MAGWCQQQRVSSRPGLILLRLTLALYLLYPSSGALPWDRQASGSPVEGHKVVSGTFSRPVLVVGYHKIVEIPAGATDIRIQESVKTRNYLALRTQSGVSIINGNWAIDRPGLIVAVGTRLTYRRPNEIRSRTGESITAPGPTTEELHLYLIYQQPGPSVYYEYSLPLQDTHTSTEPHTHPAILPLVETVGPTYSGSDDVTSGLGVVINDVGGGRGHPNQVPSDPVVNPVLLAPSYGWISSGHTACSASCGGGRRQVLWVCVETESQTTVPGDLCSHAQRPQNQEVVCNTQPCPAFWDLGEWSECTRTCGPGTQQRQVICRQALRKHGNSTATVVAVEMAQCGGYDRPETTSPCQLKICSEWQIRSEWSLCSVPCGVGQSSREVVCVGNQGDVEGDEQCNLGVKPAPLQNCDMGPCARNWFTSPWSTQCSAECGNGTQTRGVACLLHDNGRLEAVDQSNCSHLDRPMSSQSCHLKVCGVQWYATDWSTCSRSCDGGYRVREVCCLADNMTPSELCDLSATPESREDCNTQPCLPETVSSCSDQYYNCVFVVQARLCVYSYYRTACCSSCSVITHTHSSRTTSAGDDFPR
ncbi:thrombospondin type-1 domain-containing protein 4-like isoform X3 [Oncorhynchus mykiss]|uniref:thrombospondin type-1 domain-containing protein 4-like isoform X3 n=1 Tax=Oncorhynchus mykiss TaxID=8022 RepID=UPI001877BBBB|nr:thrombospondin type-1 domain-containing protein 4-like isoform X3 [Oncorhynchus mykiss]